jgi:transcriptional regulator with XRE-family HTH domain
MESFVARMEASLAKQVRVELMERDMEQQDLADAVGIEPATLSRYLRGRRSFPMPTFLKVAQTLAVPPHVLLQRAEARISAAAGTGD